MILDHKLKCRNDLSQKLLTGFDDVEILPFIADIANFYLFHANLFVNWWKTDLKSPNALIKCEINSEFH